jgi:ABC-type glycerol-3-phosphate transport system substrate-binding protein
MYKKSIFLLLIIAVLLTSGFGCAGTSKKVQQAMQPVALTYWGAWDNSDAFDQVIGNYKSIHPYVSIQYRKFRYDEYEKALIEAFATDRGPDIFSIPNTWIKKYKEKGLLAPMPDSILWPTRLYKARSKKKSWPNCALTKA